MWSIPLGAPAKCGAYGGFDLRWGRHSARALNAIDLLPGARHPLCARFCHALAQGSEPVPSQAWE